MCIPDAARYHGDLNAAAVAVNIARVTPHVNEGCFAAMIPCQQHDFKSEPCRNEDYNYGGYRFAWGLAVIMVLDKESRNKGIGLMIGGKGLGFIVYGSGLGD